MKITVKSGNIENFTTQVIIIPVFSDAANSEEDFKKLDNLLGRALTRSLETNAWMTKEGNFEAFFTNKRIKADRVVLAGLGKQSELDVEKVRQFGGNLVGYLKAKKTKEFAILAFGFLVKDTGVEHVTQAFLEGALLRDYSFDVYKSKKQKNDKNEEEVKLEQLYLIPQHAHDTNKLGEGVGRANIICSAVTLVRDLVNLPANIVNPAYLAKRAKEEAKTAHVLCKVLDLKAIQKEKMGCILGVAQGSINEPKFIVLEYNGAKKTQAPLVLVGKGVCFDSGGINLKPTGFIENMKDDMAGAATVMAAVLACAKLKLPIHIISLMPCVENMPGGHAYRPGDVIVSASGKTIEVKNTDAEGRLILADALWYAERYKPSAIVDVATLTGACMVALGAKVTGIMSNNDDLVKKLLDASKKTAELAWQLPIFKEHIEDIKGDLADINNVGHPKGYGGAITAAAFLKEFVGDAHWAHLDIAGPSWTDTQGAYLSKGGTGTGVRLLVQFLEDQSKN
ncbi:leucyl aminopeptidase [Candidatus Woesearchaeota archaeon]|nr:leucyl aminopeptidase [Candidatus Woesearchaeota archaeon]